MRVQNHGPETPKLPLIAAKEHGGNRTHVRKARTKLELELIQPHMAPVLRGEVGSATDHGGTAPCNGTRGTPPGRNVVDGSRGWSQLGMHLEHTQGYGETPPRGASEAAEDPPRGPLVLIAPAVLSAPRGPRALAMQKNLPYNHGIGAAALGTGTTHGGIQFADSVLPRIPVELWPSDALESCPDLMLKAGLPKVADYHGLTLKPFSPLERPIIKRIIECLLALSRPPGLRGDFEDEGAAGEDEGAAGEDAAGAGGGGAHQNQAQEEWPVSGAEETDGRSAHAAPTSPAGTASPGRTTVWTVPRQSKTDLRQPPNRHDHGIILKRKMRRGLRGRWRRAERQSGRGWTESSGGRSSSGSTVVHEGGISKRQRE